MRQNRNWRRPLRRPVVVATGTIQYLRGPSPAMEFRQLSYFPEIAQPDSFLQAAVRLSINQPI
jgi:hypothetical protein